MESAKKAYTRNASLRHYKLNAHLSNTYNCLTCDKKFRRQEDMAKHAKVCLKEKLELNDDKNTFCPAKSAKQNK